MHAFLDEHFLLKNETARRLYHDYAKPMPIIDYHCHLSSEYIARNHQFENLTQIWLYGDHYKWRAMRTMGVDEAFITGTKSDEQKFLKWAQTVPYTVRNPLYHWTHLELQRYFGIHQLLDAASARGIYQDASAQLREPQNAVRGLIRRMGVVLICTTDDPVDDLAYHGSFRQEAESFGLLPAFRPDKAMDVDDAAAFQTYLGRLEQASNRNIATLKDYLDALKSRHDFFHQQGCGVSDHGLEEMYVEPYQEADIARIFEKLRASRNLDASERLRFKSAMLRQFAEWDWERGWVQQYHLGAIRNNNSRRMRQQGPDTGWDSIGDFRHARPLATFLNNLDREGKLAKTILYNLNPADNEIMATMIGNFNDGSLAGKIQFGSAWWFLDQKDGMLKQMNALSNMGLLSQFVGMLTDSRSFMSYPRHEYFRRILCNVFGEEMEGGELPADEAWMGKIIQDICYYNARRYFGWEQLPDPRTQA